MLLGFITEKLVPVPKVLVALSEGATLAAPQRTTAPLVDGGEVARGDEMRRSMLFPAGAGRIQLISPRR